LSDRSTRRSARAFAARVIAWQREHGRRDLPWQGTRDAYRIWLSEIMLQQTQVATVLPYYRRFVDEFPTVSALASAPLARVLELWSGLGYYRRAHHLHAAARIVVDQHGGRFPDDAATLETLPGIGRSTAAAIAAFARGERGAILDGNVKRVLARHRGIEGWPGAPAVAGALWRVAHELLPPETGGAPAPIARYTQGLMDLGATVCTRTRPRCDACPVAGDCVARREGTTASLPSPRPRKALPRREIAVFLLERDGKVLLEQRPPVGIWAGLWSLPEAPAGTDVETWLAGRFNAMAGWFRSLPPLTHAFTHFSLTMRGVRVPIAQWPNGAEAPGVAWFEREAALAAALPAPIRRMLEVIPDRAQERRPHNARSLRRLTL
jgi:A/G-specific adenine glycosylase